MRTPLLTPQLLRNSPPLFEPYQSHKGSGEEKSR